MSVKGLAVISGATGSIGRAVVAQCWAAGYDILALGHTPEKCQALTDWFVWNTMDEGRQRGYVLGLDLAQPHDLYQINNLLDTLGGIVDLLVTCHGLPPQPTDARYCAAVAQKLWQCDVMGTVHLCQLVGSKMVAQQWGSIVLVSSAHAHATYPQRAPYVMAKSAICGLARALAVEWGPFNVGVNALVPWQVQNERSETVANQERADSGIDTLELYRQRSPLRQLVSVEDIARTVLWLADTPSMSGAKITMDCATGASMWHRPFLEISYA
jgi:NAD(P)-dependent dehydrogenase (short-subunit alcohol dehydrogenase family)